MTWLILISRPSVGKNHSWLQEENWCARSLALRNGGKYFLTWHIRVIVSFFLRGSVTKKAQRNWHCDEISWYECIFSKHHNLPPPPTDLVKTAIHFAASAVAAKECYIELNPAARRRDLVHDQQWREQRDERVLRADYDDAPIITACLSLSLSPFALLFFFPRTMTFRDVQC